MIVAVERGCPDPAREPVAPALLHQLEEDGLAAAVGELARAWTPSLRGRRTPRGSRARPQGQRAPPRFTTMWPISPAAPRPSQSLRSRTMPPPTPVPHQTPRNEENGLPAPELQLTEDGRLDVVVDPHRRAERLGERGGEREGRLPVRQVARVGDGAGLLVDGARRADADAAQLFDGRRPRTRRPRPRPLRSRPRRRWALRRSGSDGVPGRRRRGRARRRRPGSSWPRGRCRPGRSASASQADRVEVAGYDLVARGSDVVDVVVLGMEVAARERVEPA